MFDWDDQDQVGDSIWGEFPENEDDIVPYHKGTEENIVPILGNYSRKQKNEKVSTALGSSAQTSGPKNDILEINQDNSSTFITSEELSAAQLDVDSWPDLPSLSTTLGKEYNDPCNRDSMETQLMLDISGATNLDKIGVQLDSPSEIFANDKDEESDAFLDCDWANIGDIEDLDKIFSGNDSIFGHEMVGNAGEFLSASSDIISSTVPSIPLPDVPLSKDQPSVHDSSSFHLEKLSAGKETPEEKTADCTVGTGSKYYEAHNLFSNKIGRAEVSVEQMCPAVKDGGVCRIGRSTEHNTSQTDWAGNVQIGRCRSKTPHEQDASKIGNMQKDRLTLHEHNELKLGNMQKDQLTSHEIWRCRWSGTRQSETRR